MRSVTGRPAATETDALAVGVACRALRKAVDSVMETGGKQEGKGDVTAVMDVMNVTVGGVMDAIQTELVANGV